MLSLDEIKQMVYLKFKDGHLKRYTHTIGVSEMACLLAEKYNVDVNKACIASLMHDYCKYDNPKDLEKYFTQEEILECRKYPFLYHAYGSSYKYKELVGDDEEIFSAIYNHVFGKENMTMLEKIIMISDYTEIYREYKDCIICRDILLNKSLDEAILYSLEHMIEFIKKEGLEPHPRQIKVYEEYKRKVG